MKYFEYEEFDSPDIQGSGQMMSKEMLSKLDMIREEYGKPIHINSGYRTEAHNEKVGGKPASSHLKGLAVDLACSESRERFYLIKLFSIDSFCLFLSHSVSFYFVLSVFI